MRTAKSLSLVILMIMSTLVALIPAAPSAMANNHTSAGEITGVETWTGSHTLTGDVKVAGGATLIIDAGTTIQIPNGTFIEVEGAICAGSSTCGAIQASTGSPVRFIWGNPANSSAPGRCSFNSDAKCGEGLVLRSTIDTSKTALSYVEFNNAYGYPIPIGGSGNPSLGALIFDGASISADHLKFSDINTSNIIAANLAAPTLTDSTFVVGTDGEGWDASAIRAYGSGTGILSTFTIRDSSFTGSNADDCSSQSGGRSVLFIEDSYIDLQTLSISNNAYGMFLSMTSGSVSDTTIDVQCNGIDTNGYKSTGSINHWLKVTNNSITTADGAGMTAYDGARVIFDYNSISGASEGSGIGVRGATLRASNNVIGPIGGWNGVWVYGDSFEVSLENNSIFNTTKEAILIGEYHYQDIGWSVPSPTKGRAYIVNNTIQGNQGTCNSDKMYGGDFDCPAFHIFMSSATINDNTVTTNNGDGIRATGAIINVNRNNMEVGDFAVRATVMDDNYGNKYATLGYFSENTWTGASQVYNVTESSITVQSEYMPDPDPASGELYPVNLGWFGAECPWVANECIKLSNSKLMPPRSIPVQMYITNNATVFQYSNLTNFDLSKAHIQNQNTAWGVQIQRAELVRMRTIANGVHVADADVIIQDKSTGREVYNMTTGIWGYTPWFSLASNFHIDTNWNHFANDPGEDSCNDGLDNDGDAVYDADDPDCHSGNSRELSHYSVTAYRVGKGSSSFDLTVSGQLDAVVTLTNMAPSVKVNQENESTFKWIISITGESWDGATGPYFSDYDANIKQFGQVEEIQVKPPGVVDWDDAYIAVDTSGSGGIINKTNHPWKTWSFEWDMAQQPEDDYTFEFRAHDGLDYSPVLTRIFQLNTVAPTLYVDSPANHSSFDTPVIVFSGRVEDPYGNGAEDVRENGAVHLKISGPGYDVTTLTTGGAAWTYEWSTEGKVSGEYSFKIWASDSNFCRITYDECVYREIVLEVDNDNDRPSVELSSPLPDASGRLKASKDTMIEGSSRDTDGQVTKIEILVEDLQTGQYLTNAPDRITTFTIVGNYQLWSVVWDTTTLTHDFQYKVSVRAYDGYDWSLPSNMTFTIDNKAENIRPEFNGSAWREDVTLFCDRDSRAENPCSKAEVNMFDYFSDADGDLHWYSFEVLNIQCDLSQVQMITEDDCKSLLVPNTQGVFTYNPLDAMDLLGANADLSLENVQFRVTDANGSEIESSLMNFWVSYLDFIAERSDGEWNDPITEDNPAIFTGRARPGEVVYLRLTDGKREINRSIAGSDGYWKMEVNERQLSGSGLTDVYFQYGASEIPVTLQSGEVIEESSGMVLYTIGGIVILAILLGLFAFFFVEFEDEEGFEEQKYSEEAVAPVDPYEWAKDRIEAEVVQSAVATSAQTAPAPQPVTDPEYPGWLWDPATQQWVPDPNYQTPSQ